MTAVTRTFGVTATEVGAIDSWVEAIGATWGAGERTVFRARLCLAELANNVLEHARTTSTDDHMIVTLMRREDGIEIEFADTRGPFDPLSKAAAARPTSLEAARPGGLGLKLIRAYADDLTYCHDGTHNRLRLKIRSDNKKPAGEAG